MSEKKSKADVGDRVLVDMAVIEKIEGKTGIRYRVGANPDSIAFNTVVIEERYISENIDRMVDEMSKEHTAVNGA